MCFSGGVCFGGNLSNDDSSFVPSDMEKAEVGVSICNEERNSDEEYLGTVDEESDD